MNVVTNGNMKIITSNENKILIYGTIKCAILYTPITFDESLLSEVDYFPDVIEASESKKIKDKVNEMQDRITSTESAILDILMGGEL